MIAQASGPLPVPDYFPVEWPEPALQTMHWTWDQVHHPHPKTPLTATFEAPAFSEGASRGFQALSLPLNWRALVVNGYWYGSFEFLEAADTFPPPWWPRVEEEFMRRLPTAAQTWEQVYLPEVQEMNRRLREYDYEGASLADLLAFIDRCYEMRVRAFDLHMQAVMPVVGAAGRFAELYQQMLGGSGGAEPFGLLQGFDNLTMESGKELWRLSRRVLAQPAIAKLVLNMPVERLPEELQGSPEGRAVLQEFEQYLERFGWRSDAFELADPAWVEDPGIPLTTLREYLLAPDDADPALREQRSREERERLVQDSLERLEGHAGKPIFEMLLGFAQQYLPIQENHNFYIDQMLTVLLRRPFLELGCRLVVAGAIAKRDDIFYLRWDELAQAATGPGEGEWASRVTRRRADLERWAAVVPPREIGTPLPPELSQNPLSAAFFGEQPEPSTNPKVITGVAASAGTVTATVRVIHSLAEAGKLQPGDALVCEMTMPAWTPLFATVAAVVADSGGVLSHCAIVAREYGVPCVVGTQVGTRVLKDGQRITVDGSQGIVRIED